MMYVKAKKNDVPLSLAEQIRFEARFVCIKIFLNRIFKNVKTVQ